MVRAAASGLPPVLVTAAEDPAAPATKPTASPAANSWKGSRRAGRHSRRAARVATMVARHSTIIAPARTAGWGRYTYARVRAQPPPRWYRHSVVRTGAPVSACGVVQLCCPDRQPGRRLKELAAPAGPEHDVETRLEGRRVGAGDRGRGHDLAGRGGTEGGGALEHQLGQQPGGVGMADLEVDVGWGWALLALVVA